MAVNEVLSSWMRKGCEQREYDQDMTQFAGNQLHITGATMLDAIWQAAGRDRVMQVLRDPRQLLADYNRSVRSQPKAYRFPSALAQQVATIGQ